MAKTVTDYSSALILQSKEEVLRSWRDVIPLDDSAQIGLEKGYLVLTNQRCIFIKKTGIFTKNYEQTMTFDLDKIPQLTAKKTMGILEDSHINLYGKKFHFREPNAIKDIINQQRTKRLEELKQLELNEQEREEKKKTKMKELEIKGFSEKEIDLIINSEYSEDQIYEMRDAYKKKLPQKQAQPVQQPPQPQSDININIGKIGDDTISKTTNTTVKDSIVQRSNIGQEQAESEISICPYCGKDLKFPKTPRFCPYCREQILM